MQRTKAPFRADEVGSLLRPPRIKEARAKLEKGEITAEDLRKAEDLEIEKVVHKQASVGLKLATDGEFRRSWWHFDFLAKLTGCELFHPDTGIQFAGVQTRHDSIRVIGNESPSGPWIFASSYHHCGVGRLKSVPVEYQWAPSRTMISPLRGQLTESFAQLPPAATHTTFSLS